MAVHGGTSRWAALIGAASALTTFATAPVAARDLNTITVETEGVVETRGFNNIRDAIDIIEFGRFDQVNNAYTDTSIANTVTDFRGVNINVDYLTNGTTLTFSIPDLNYTREFTGATRSDSEDELIDFLETNGDGILTDILKLSVRASPVDPVAGNPGSIMSKMVEADFSVGTTVGPGNRFAPTSSRSIPAEDAEAAAEEDDGAPNLIGLQARFGRFATDDFDSTVVDLPLSYVIPLADPRYAVQLDLPLTFVEVNGAQSYAGSFGVGVRVPVLDNWFITPALRAGAVGSEEIGAAGILYSGSITSNFTFNLGDFSFSIGNGITGLQTLPIDYDNTELDYDLTNFVFRNGVGVGGPIDYQVFGEPLTWEAAVVNTQFTGDDLYVENSTDISVSIGTAASRNGLTWDSFRLGLTYTITDTDYDGFRMNFGYQF